MSLNLPVCDAHGDPIQVGSIVCIRRQGNPHQGKDVPVVALDNQTARIRICVEYSDGTDGWMSPRSVELIES